MQEARRKDEVYRGPHGKGKDKDTERARAEARSILDEAGAPPTP
jgi:hypothetical protein